VLLPDPTTALQEPDGLLAAGGALTTPWLLSAYRRGIFPWFGNDDKYILWWCPSRRAVLEPGTMRITRSLAKRIRNAGFDLSMDRAFPAVIAGCSEPRGDVAGTWITPDMRGAYIDLHEQGHAHSVEVWYQGRLVGGLYGIAVGRVFCGESMFSRMADASKVAFHALQRQLADWSFRLIDCQIMNPHLASLGVYEISREDFLQELAEAVTAPELTRRWSFDIATATF